MTPCDGTRYQTRVRIPLGPPLESRALTSTGFSSPAVGEPSTPPEYRRGPHYCGERSRGLSGGVERRHGNGTETVEPVLRLHSALNRPCPDADDACHGVDS